MQPRSLSFVIPAYNEKANIGTAVREALAAGARHAPRFEVIVVDDGSADGTAETAAAAAAGDPRVRVVRHASNHGVGEALKTGFREARCDLVYWFPGDNQVEAAEVARFLPHVDRADIVAGRRVVRADPVHRTVNAKLYNLFLRVFFAVRIHDTDCNKLFRRAVFDRITIASSGMLVDAEILIKARRAGFRIVETAVTHRPRTGGQPSGAQLRNILKVFVELATLWRQLR